DLLRRARRHADVIVRGAEEGIVPADLLRDPDGEAVVVDTEGVVVPQQRAVEVLPVKENADFHNVAACRSYHACAAAPNFSPLPLVLCRTCPTGCPHQDAVAASMKNAPERPIR